MRKTALVACLVLAWPAFAAPKIVGDHQVQPGGFAQLAVEGAGKTVIWTVTPEPIQDAEFSGTLVFTGYAGQAYTATAIVIDFEKKTAEKLKHTVRFLGDPSPPAPPGPVPPGPTPPDPKPPDPKPPDPPVPPPNPPPIPAEGLHVLIVYESADLSTYPAPQVAAMYAGSVHAYLNARCPVGPDGKTKQWRVWDQNVDTTGESQLWRLAMARKRDKLPWIIVSNGKAGWEGPLPGNTADVLMLLKKYGGE